ncbi:HyaD/HybD family hydrogenase maturation endopeptidase [Brevibacillus ginsengisoli]|uniref:HyaD/HybD family hydrogenase maturation endopeptidase n=1 Tax=Brevibacillus ginsengisoli TaxID=363854 RepID=UPI003CE7E725
MTNNNHQIIHEKKTIKILGIGNLLYQDEGLGIHILPLLRECFDGQDDVEVIEGATDGILLLDPVEATDHLIIVDAIHAGVQPGDLITVRDEEIPLYMGVKMSIHQVGFQEVLAAAKLRERLPRHMLMCGIQPHSLELGLELTDVAQAKLPELVSLIQQQVDEWRSILAHGERERGGNA